MQFVAIICIPALLFAVSEAISTSNTGAGTIYKLSVTQDVWIEGPAGNSNKNGYEFLIVGKHPQYEKKRSLLQFESLPTGPADCAVIRWAKMYVYFLRPHKASWQSVLLAPLISRTLQVYQVKQPWDEAQATSVNRLSPNTPWNTPYMALGGSDAGPQVIGSTTICANHPRNDFVEFDITDAMLNWKNGDSNYGVLLLAQNENVDGQDLRFASNTNSDASRRAYVNVLCN